MLTICARLPPAADLKVLPARRAGSGRSARTDPCRAGNNKVARQQYRHLRDAAGTRFPEWQAECLEPPPRGLKRCGKSRTPLEGTPRAPWNDPLPACAKAVRIRKSTQMIPEITPISCCLCPRVRRLIPPHETRTMPSKNLHFPNDDAQAGVALWAENASGKVVTENGTSCAENSTNLLLAFWRFGQK